VSGALARVKAFDPRELARGNVVRSQEESMDANRFDDLSRMVGEDADRRGLLKAAAGGALGLLGIAALGGDALAKKCNNNNDCGNNEKCKNRECRKKCNNNKDCKNDEKCKNGVCWTKCNDNKDCKNKEKCKNGVCKNK
jgi:hypothetical protein